MIRVALESIWGMSANAYPPERQCESVNLVRSVVILILQSAPAALGQIGFFVYELNPQKICLAPYCGAFISRTILQDQVKRIRTFNRKIRLQLRTPF